MQIGRIGKRVGRWLFVEIGWWLCSTEWMWRSADRKRSRHVLQLHKVKPYDGKSRWLWKWQSGLIRMDLGKIDLVVVIGTLKKERWIDT